MTTSEVSLLQKELHRVSDQVQRLSDQVANIETDLQGRVIAQEELAEFKRTLGRWMVGATAALTSIITVSLALIDRI